jgi:ABC-type uncharacterized transport system permease subunit
MREAEREKEREVGEAMFCVACGAALTAENQEGIVCQWCRQEIETRRVQVVTVNYCYMCGCRFTPSDNAIRHLCCKEQTDVAH